MKQLLNLMGDRLHSLPLVVLYLTDGCNSRCITCDIWRNPRRSMALELVDEIVAAVAELQIRWVLLSGGEAMQHPHWPEIARRFQDAGTYVMLLTNGLLLRKQAADVQRHVDEVIVSLDAGTPATYAAIRGVDAFDLVMAGIRALPDVPVTTRTTVQRANYRELPQIVRAAKFAGVERISFLTVDVSSAEAFGPRFTPDPTLTVNDTGLPSDPAQTALTSADVQALAEILDDLEREFADEFASGLIAESPAKLRRMVRYFAAINGTETFAAPRCNAPHISTVIEVDGSLRPCYFLPKYGQLGAQKLGDAINTPPAQALRQAYRRGQRTECATCVCPLYKGPRALLRL
jgi:Fe-coproporphyrin III synthase